jgi:hypothetical protein
MMMTHRIMLKTHPLFDDTRSLRPFDLIQKRFANDEAPRRRHADAPSGTRGSRVRVRRVSFLFCAEVILAPVFFDPRRELA